MDTQAIQLRLPDKISEIYQAGRSEFTDTTPAERATLAATLGGLAFEWGTGNEALIGAVGANVHNLTHSPVAAGLASGGASFAEQGTLGLLMAATISVFPKVADTVRDVFTKREKTEGEQSKTSRFLEAMALGSAVSLAKKNALQERSRIQNIRHALGSAAIVGAANTALVAGVSGIVSLGEGHGLEHEADLAVNVASNPLTYAGLFGAALAYNKVKKMWRERGNAQGEQIKPQEHDLLQGVPRREILKRQDEGLTIVASREVSEVDRESLWGVIETGFAALNRRSYENQSMALDEFIADMDSPNVVKYIAYDDDNIPLGLIVAHDNVEDATWANQELLGKAQAEADPEARSYYVGTLVVSPDKRGTTIATRLVQAAISNFRETNERDQKNSLGFFDCAAANHPWLSEYVGQIMQPSDDFEGVPIGVRELGVEYWTEDVTDGGSTTQAHAIKKMNLSPEEASNRHVLDAQHFYAIEIKQD
jgi:GNAT superfamily N-acetyltransferase